MSTRVHMIWPDELVASVKVAASEAGMTRTQYVLWALDAVAGADDPPGQRRRPEPPGLEGEESPRERVERLRKVGLRAQRGGRSM